MTSPDDKISRRQYMATAFVAILSQLIRRVPREISMVAGRAAWLAPAAAALPLLLLLLFLRALLQKKREGYSLCMLFTDALGGFFGKLLIFIYSLWLVFYCGFLLRNSAERFISTAYPDSAPLVFILSMGLVCLIAGLSRFKAISRSAMIFRPLMLGCIFLILLLSISGADFRLLLPVTASDAVPVGRAALKVTNVAGLIAFMGFADHRTEGNVRLRDYLPWMGALLLIAACITVSCTAVLGPELTAKSSMPFFMVVRDLTAFGAVERIEPLIIAIWVLSDYILISALIFICGENLRYCFGIKPPERSPRVRELSHGRWLNLLCVAASSALALFMAPNASSLDLLSERLVPFINSVLVFVLLPLVFIIGRVRKTV